MNNTIKNLFIFTVGAAIGSAVTCKLLREKYEQMAQEEIDSVKEVFSRNREVEAENSEEDTDEIDDETVVKKDNKIAKEIIEAMRYSNNEEDDDDMEGVHVIPPDEFAEEEDYDVVSLTLYSDGVLTDEMDIRIENPDAMIGPKALDTFGEYEEDSVFVRNDDQECYYEILKDNRKYSEVVSEDE